MKLKEFRFWRDYYELKEEFLKGLNVVSFKHYELYEFMSRFVNEKGILILKEKDVQRFIEENTFINKDVDDFLGYIESVFLDKYKQVEYKVLSQIIYEFYKPLDAIEMLKELKILSSNKCRLLDNFKKISEKYR